jgi:ABC-2 type transport system permease protein
MSSAGAPPGARPPLEGGAPASPRGNVAGDAGAARFSFARWWAIVLKEFLQLRRDRITFAMIVGIPIVQLTLFGYAINTDPREMPTALIVADASEFTRSVAAAMQTSGYFRIVSGIDDEDAARHALAQGRVQFVVSIPVDFARRLARGERPSLLVEADATDPLATSMALAAAAGIVDSVSRKDVTGPLARLAATPSAFAIDVHRLYNPEANTQYNIVPGLMGVILTMTMVMMTGLAITRERERGTMENLLATPARPLEVMSGKIVPYIAIGLVQATIILLAAHWIFAVPLFGSIVALYVTALLFVAANLTVGITLSSLAQNQLQAVQLTFFYFLPNILLSGFMFPFQGMPRWAQWLGSLLPLTHFNRLVRGILLKGNDFADLWPDIWPLVAFTVIVMTIALTFYRRTLD